MKRPGNSSIDFSQISAHPIPEESPGFLLWQVSIRWRRSIEEILKPLQLTHPQFVVLACIGWLTRSGKKVSQAVIARQTGLDPNTASQILRSLQTKKFIERIRSQDERSKYPILTSAGSDCLVKALPAVESADARFFASLDLHESGLIKILQQLALINSS